jgi:hypothetical protein
MYAPANPPIAPEPTTVTRKPSTTHTVPEKQFKTFQENKHNKQLLAHPPAYKSMVTKSMAAHGERQILSLLLCT